MHLVRSNLFLTLGDGMQSVYQQHQCAITLIFFIMKSIWVFILLFPLLTFAQNSIYVPELGTGYANGNVYRRMMYSDSGTVTLLSVGVSDTPNSFHQFNLSDGSLVSIEKAVCPTFDLKYAVSKLPNIQIGSVSYPNLIFTAVRNDSVFLVNTKFTQSLDFVEILDFAYLAVNGYCESTEAITNPDNGEHLSFLSFFLNGDNIARSHALVKVSPNHKLEVTRMDSAESQKLEILHFVKDLSFLDGYYYITGYSNSPLSAILDSSLNVVDKGNTNYFDQTNSNNDFSLRGYITRQVAPGKIAIIGDGNFYVSLPPVVKVTSQIVAVENGEIVFKERTSYAKLDRDINGVVATYPNPTQPALFLAGAEPETPFDITKSYIYFKKLVNEEEILYKRYGDDRYYSVLNIDFLENGNLVICGQSTTSVGAPVKGFFMFLNQEGDPVSTNNVTPRPETLRVFPTPTTDRLYMDIGPKDDALFVITDLMGHTLLSEKNINQEYIDVSSLLPGMYFLNVYSDSRVYVSKFVKKY
jgi:hypothetical protein